VCCSRGIAARPAGMDRADRGPTHGAYDGNRSRSPDGFAGRKRALAARQGVDVGIRRDRRCWFVVQLRGKPVERLYEQIELPFGRVLENVSTAEHQIIWTRSRRPTKRFICGAVRRSAPTKRRKHAEDAQVSGVYGPTSSVTRDRRGTDWGPRRHRIWARRPYRYTCSRGGPDRRQPVSATGTGLAR